MWAGSRSPTGASAVSRSRSSGLGRATATSTPSRREHGNGRHVVGRRASRSVANSTPVNGAPGRPPSPASPIATARVVPRPGRTSAATIPRATPIASAGTRALRGSRSRARARRRAPCHHEQHHHRGGALGMTSGISDCPRKGRGHGPVGNRTKHHCDHTDRAPATTSASTGRGLERAATSWARCRMPTTTPAITTGRATPHARSVIRTLS